MTFPFWIISTCQLFALGLAAALAAGHPFLETPALRFEVSPADGSYTILDKPASRKWQSNPFRRRFGSATTRLGGQLKTGSLGPCSVEQADQRLALMFQPAGWNASTKVVVTVQAASNHLDFSWAAEPAGAVESIRLLDDTLWVTDTGGGFATAPVREGLLIPADSGLAFEHRFDTYAYEGCHLQMWGLYDRQSAVLVTWNDPYVAVTLRSSLTNLAGFQSQPCKQALSTSLELRQSAKSFRLTFCGKGDYVTLGKAYQQAAREKGYLVRWEEKLKKHPDDAKLFGAVNFKLWSTLSRQMSEDGAREISSQVSWTFDEAAQVATHLRRDLEMEKVLFIIGGWIRRGYDNQHPDILPSAPECGGDPGLAECVRKVQELGYLFSLHDNYQDIYRDAPSWDESYVMRNRDGSLTKGGHWAGGLAYLTCSRKALELARRPQNLPAVQRLTGAKSYFIDTTYAAGLQECFDPQHPLTRQDDLKYKQDLSDYARDLFGVFGSECGREWAIPHSDFFEGLTGVSGNYFHDEKLPAKLGASVVPLFELVYHDTIAMYGKYGYDMARSANYVLHHLALGRPLHYHEIPSHLYWKNTAREPATPAAAAAVFMRGDQGWTEGLHPVDRFVKNTYEILSPLNELTSLIPMEKHEFLTRDRLVQKSTFGAGTAAMTVVVNTSTNTFTCRSQAGGEVELPPLGFLVDGPEFAAFHASQWNGKRYPAPTCFTLRSMDGTPLAQSQKIRVYHAFGDPGLRLGTSEVKVLKAQVVSPGRD